MKKTIALQLMIMMLCVFVPFAKAETVTILNCDKVNIRNDAGQSLGRLGCYTPVSVGETKGDSTYITASRAYLELYQEQYEYSEYIDFYSGDISGWVKTRCLSEVNEEMDHVIYKAEEYRWEYFVDGIYHEIKSNGIVKSQCYEPRKTPTISTVPLTAHVKYRDIINKGSAYYNASSSNEGWREAYYTFINDQQYLSMSLEYDYRFSELHSQGNDDIEICLYDFNQDGIPELIMDSGDPLFGGGMPFHAFFTYRSGKGVVYIGLGPVHRRQFIIVSNQKYHGLLWTGGSTGGYYGDYYYYDNATGTIKSKVVFNNFDDQFPHAGIYPATDDLDLYQLCRDVCRNLVSDRSLLLATFLRHGILGLDGWNAFLKSYGY